MSVKSTDKCFYPSLSIFPILGSRAFIHLRNTFTSQTLFSVSVNVVITELQKKLTLGIAMPSLVEKTEQKRSKKCLVCSVFYVRNGRHVRFVRYDWFQMKTIVGMFGVESKKASVCSVMQDSVCSVWSARKIRYVRFGQIRYNRFQTKETVGMFGLERKKASVCLVLQDSVG